MVRDIPVYNGWIDEKIRRSFCHVDEFVESLRKVLDGKVDKREKQAIVLRRVALSVMYCGWSRLTKQFWRCDMRIGARYTYFPQVSGVATSIPYLGAELEKPSPHSLYFTLRGG